MVGFIFGGDTQETPDSIKRKRELVRALMSAQGAPRNIGEGLNALGDGIVANVMDRRADKAEKAGMESANSAFAPLVSALSGSSSPTTASAIPSPGAASEIQSTGAPTSGNPDLAATESYIREAATKRGIDPEVAVKVARSEGLAPGVWQSNVVRKDGGRETSYGPYQLLVGGGLGDKFQKVYGKSPSDPSTLNQQIDFALDEAAQGGWSPWYGAAKVGVGARTGLDNARALGYQPTPQPAQVASLDPSAGMPSGSPIQPPPVNQPAPSPTPGYVDPRVTTEGRAPMQGPTQQAPQLAPPTTIANAPQVAAQPQVPAGGVQQVAQAMAGAPQGSGVDIGQIQQALSNPFLSPGQRSVANALLEQELGRRNTAYEQQLKQNDPKYKLDLEKGQLELQNLREPKMSPSEQANINLNREKFKTEQENRGNLTAAERADADAQNARLKLDRDKFDAEMQKGQWQKMTDGRLYNQTTGDFRDAPPPAPGSVTPKFDDVSGMRKEIQQLPSYKNLAAAAPIYKAMSETAGRDSKASDLNLVYGLGKIMDPTSVVREGEMIMVKNTASLPDWLQGAISSLNGGAALTPETRQAIMTEAYGRVKGYNDEFQQNMGQYQGIVQRNGINPADVIPEVDKFEPWAAPAPQPGAPNIGTDWQELSPGVRIRKKAQ
jgi:hypothetical protein